MKPPQLENLSNKRDGDTKTKHMIEYIQRLERYLKLIAENPTQEGIQYIPHSGTVAANLAKEALNLCPECGHLPVSDGHGGCAEPGCLCEYDRPICGAV